MSRPTGVKTYLRGTHRSASPEDTLARARPLAARAGITRTADITGLDVLGIPVTAVYRPTSLSLVVSQGKGVGPLDARASGLMESIEIWAAEQTLPDTRLATYRELRDGSSALDPLSLPGACDESMHEARIAWVRGSSLRTSAATWLPRAVVSTDYSLPYEAGTCSLWVSTNGLASGNSREEALVHALCEVIERDADAIWRRRPGEQRRSTRVDLESIPPGHCRQLLERYYEAGLAVGVWSICADVGVPAFRCEVIETRTPARPAFFAPPSAGTGCHPDREVALARALCEAAQARLTAISGAREDLGPVFYEPDEALVEKKVRELASSPAEVICLETVPHASHPSIEDDLGWLLDRLADAGMREVVAVDLPATRDFDLWAARVVVPGLETHPDHPSYRPGPRATGACNAR